MTYLEVGRTITPQRAGNGGRGGVIPNAVALGVCASLARRALTSVYALGLTSATSSARNLRAHASFC